MVMQHSIQGVVPVNAWHLKLVIVAIDLSIVLRVIREIHYILSETYEDVNQSIFAEKFKIMHVDDCDEEVSKVVVTLVIIQLSI